MKESKITFVNLEMKSEKDEMTQAFFKALKESEKIVCSDETLTSNYQNCLLSSPYDSIPSEFVTLSNLTSPGFLSSVESFKEFQEVSTPVEKLASLYGKRKVFSLGNLFGTKLIQVKELNPNKTIDDFYSNEEETSQKENEKNKRKGGSRNEYQAKGLKSLTVAVKEILTTKESVSFKEVAKLILEEHIKKKNLFFDPIEKNGKEEQNIKRRVYDALNVLVSSGYLIKEGKIVRKNEVSKRIKTFSKQSQIESLRTSLAQQKDSIKSKKIQLEKNKYEVECLHRLIERNKTRSDNNLISLPFFIVKASNSDSSNMHIKKQIDCQKYGLFSNRPFEFFGDLEIVSMLERQNVSK